MLLSVGRKSSMPTQSALPGGSDVCGICSLDILSARDVAINSCRHTFHRDCILEYADEATDTAEQGQPAGKGKKAPRKRNSKTKNISNTAKTCPVCFLPLQVTLDLRGMGDTDEDEVDDEETGKKTPKARKGQKGKITPLPSAESKAEKKASECVVCMDAPRNALLLPCGHVHTCMDCVSQFQRRACPVCRAPIQRVIRADRPDEVKQAASNLTDGKPPASGKRGSGAVVGRESIIQQLDMSAFASSSKVDAVLEHLAKIRKECKTGACMCMCSRAY